MKRIVAITKPNMLDDVVFALHKVEDFPGGTMTEVRDIGRGMHQRVKESRQVPNIGYAVFARLEIVCQDHQVEEIVSAIEKNAHTGKFDDGNIYVWSVEESVRIGAGQRGSDTV